MRLVRDIVTRPVVDDLAALDACRPDFRLWYALLIVLAFAATWWIYVPIHELLHAFGCVLAGGAVTRLEIDPIYGAALLHKVFPFVVVGSDYAGQLTGFDTHGSDLTYLATDFLPFTLTILIGVPLLRSAAGATPVRASVKLGAAAPIAYAPFISVTGDYYEMGSILVSRIVAWYTPGFPLDRWRSDDLFRLTSQLFLAAPRGGLGDIGGVLASVLLGAVLAFATYWLGTTCARLIVRSQHTRPGGPRR